MNRADHFQVVGEPGQPTGTVRLMLPVRHAMFDPELASPSNVRAAATAADNGIRGGTWT
jgi:hypothetical protein